MEHQQLVPWAYLLEACERKGYHNRKVRRKVILQQSSRARKQAVPKLPKLAVVQVKALDSCSQELGKKLAPCVLTQSFNDVACALCRGGSSAEEVIGSDSHVAAKQRQGVLCTTKCPLFEPVQSTAAFYSKTFYLVPRD